MDTANCDNFRAAPLSTTNWMGVMNAPTRSNERYILSVAVANHDPAREAQQHAVPCSSSFCVWLVGFHSSPTPSPWSLPACLSVQHGWWWRLPSSVPIPHQPTMDASCLVHSVCVTRTRWMIGLDGRLYIWCVPFEDTHPLSGSRLPYTGSRFGR